MNEKTEPKKQASTTEAYSRDGFAAQAMNAIVIANLARGVFQTDEEVAGLSYRLADAMLVARGK